jgi:exosortase
MKNRVLNIAAILLFVLVFGPTFIWLWQRWTISIWHNGHGMFVPLVVGYLAYHALRADKSQNEESSAWGFALFIPGLILVIIDNPIKTQLLSAVGLIFCLIGLMLLVFGARRTGAFAYPLLLLFLMLPIPTAFIDRFILFLRQISATGCAYLTDLTGMPVLREFTTLHLPNSSLVIAEACSGFSTLYASVTMALILCYMVSSNARRALILLSCFPLAIACNIVRCTALAYLVNYRGPEVLGTPLHPLTGILSFSAALGLLFAVAMLGDTKGKKLDETLEPIHAAHRRCAAADADPGKPSLLH